MRSRKLSREEVQLWALVAKTVKPLPRRVPARQEGAVMVAGPGPAAQASASKTAKPRMTAQQPAPTPAPVLRPTAEAKRPLDAHGLDSSWDKKLARATLYPDFTLDLHGHTLDTAHARLDHGLGQAIALGARLVLVITGLPRPAEAADRGQRRGAIRAKIMDWLTLGPHASRIAAVRPAHRRHGGAGALYVILRRPR